jgi:hypothetical protein
MKGRAAAAERRHDEAMLTAWHIAALPMMKKFPPTPDNLMIANRRAPKSPAQTPAEMLGVMRAWAESTRH